MVSADLSGMGKASGQPVRWLIMVNICLLPKVEVSQSVTKSIAILSNGLSGISVICRRILLNFGFVSSARDAVSNILPDVFIHSFPVILMLDEAVCARISLMT